MLWRALMSHQLEILKRYSRQDTWFLNAKYPISYKLVILNSLYKTLKSSEFTEEDFKEKVISAWTYINELPPDSFECESFSIFRFIDHEETAGVFLIDHTHSCFPLIFYNGENKIGEGKKLRVSALQKCIFDVKENYQKLFDLLQSATEWDESLQKEILKIIPEEKDSFKYN